MSIIKLCYVNFFKKGLFFVEKFIIIYLIVVIFDMHELIYGIHTIESMLKHDASCFLCVYILNIPVNRRLGLLLCQLKKFNISIQYCNRYYLNNKVHSHMHQGVVAKINRKNVFTGYNNVLCLLKKFKDRCLFLVLDSIVDPRNLGACLRCAGAFGVDMVIISRYRSVGLNSVVWKVASGVADKIPCVRVTNLVYTLRLLKQYDIWIVGTVLQTKFNIFHAKLSSSRLAIVVGSEESGIRFLVRKYCDEVISIPMVNTLSSLNVSVATGICLFEVFRNRRCNGNN